jgi:hypothetical protein
VVATGLAEVTWLVVATGPAEVAGLVAVPGVEAAGLELIGAGAVGPAAIGAQVHGGEETGVGEAPAGDLQPASRLHHPTMLATTRIVTPTFMGRPAVLRRTTAAFTRCFIFGDRSGFVNLLIPNEHVGVATHYATPNKRLAPQMVTTIAAIKSQMLPRR